MAEPTESTAYLHHSTAPEMLRAAPAASGECGVGACANPVLPGEEFCGPCMAAIYGPVGPAASESTLRDRWADRRALRRQRRAQARSLNASARESRPAGPPRWLRAAAVAVPVVLVNAVAFAGQLAFLRDHLAWPLPGQVMMAVALESIAVYLAFHAHVAQIANDSALRLRLASYVFGLVIGAMNYSHYADHWRPTFAAVALGLMSASSPWLWAVHSRRSSRDALLAQGLVEHHAVRLGSTRWAWHPIRSARVMWLATWAGITEPGEALDTAEAAFAARRDEKAAAGLPSLDLSTETLAAMVARDRLAVAFGAIGAVDVPKALALLADKGAPVDQSHAYQVRRQIAAAGAGEQS